MRDEGSGKRVENNIDASSGCNTHDAFGKIQRSGVEDVLDSKRPHEFFFLPRTHGGDHMSACRLRNLNRGAPHASGGCMNQDPISASHPGQFDEGVTGCQKRNGSGGCLLKAQARRLAQDPTPRELRLAKQGRLWADGATAMTSSPGANAMTFSPTATTRPAISSPSPNGFDGSNPG